MRILNTEELAGALTCPACRKGLLEVTGAGAMRCKGCSRSYGSDRGVMSFLLDEQMTPTNKQEIAFGLQWEKHADELLAKENWNAILKHQANWVADSIVKLLPEDPATAICALGAGSGFDLVLLLRRRQFDRVFASDISPALTRLAGISLEPFDGELGLFASEFGACPIKRDRRHFGLVFQALHHAPDAHAALDALLDHNFDELVIIEPITNPLFRVLARWDLVQRVEYTGTRPDWLDLRRVETIAKRHGLRVDSNSWWEIPPYFQKPWITNRKALWKPFCHAVEAFSAATNVVRFGSMAALKFSR